MATALDPDLTKKPFKNWLKGLIAVKYAREGLTEFVHNEITDFQRNLLFNVCKQNKIVLGTKCSSCTTANLFKCPSQEFCGRNKVCKLHNLKVPDRKPDQKCPLNICNQVKEDIRLNHRFLNPSWTISDARKWCTEAVEIAKCYLPPKGYENKNSFADIDFNGTLGIIINNRLFQNKLTSHAPDDCRKVRDMINDKIRHSASYEISDIDLVQCFGKLRDLLQDSKFLLHDQHAQYAVERINQLQNNDFEITADVLHVTKFLEELTNKNIEDLELVSQKLKESLSEVASQVVKQHIREIEAAKDKRLSTIVWETITFKEIRLNTKMKEGLVRLYNEKESMIPASPLVEDYAVPLTELYVQPPMSAFDKPNFFGQGKTLSKMTPVSSYQELFFNDANVAYKYIYVEGDAGYGKTSFTQKLALTWCQAQMPNKSLKSKFKPEEVDTLKYFDFLFLLRLRDLEGDSCNLEDIIFEFVSQNLEDRDKFSKEYISTMLKSKRCLAIIDGLDEWVHPETCDKTPGIPHNNYRKYCTVLTTTRPWKLSMIELPPTFINKHVVISELDFRTFQELKLNAVKLMSENCGEEERDSTDFDKKVSAVNIGNSHLVPYILLQLICIWFDGLSIGKSKCEIYSNTVELTLARGLKKKNKPTLPTKSSQHFVAVPECIRHNELCNQHIDLLFNLGKLAFNTLFQMTKELNFKLLIERTTVLKFLAKEDLEFCLKIGLLSLTKDTSKISVKSYTVFFQHKSVQEFFAAFYITSEWNEETTNAIFQVCESLSSILEMSNLFVFVCGMNPDFYEWISRMLQQKVDKDKVTRNYRFDVDCNNDETKSMYSYQLMQLQCFQESMRNGNKTCTIHLYDFLLLYNDTLTEDDLNVLKTIMHLNKGKLKSLQISSDEKNASFMHALEPGLFSSLETLRVLDFDKEPVWLADILNESAPSLKRLKLVGPQKRTSLSDIIITAITGLTCLQSLSLDNLTTTESNIARIADLSTRQSSSLTYLKLNVLGPHVLMP